MSNKWYSKVRMVLETDVNSVNSKLEIVDNLRNELGG